MKRRFLFLLWMSTCVLLAADWPQWRGPNRDGVSSEKIQPWKGELKVLWRQAVGEGHSSPIVAGGRVFLHVKAADAEREEVIVFDAATGQPAWRSGYERTAFKNQYGNGPRSTPLWNDGKVYTLGVTGILACWDAAKGQGLWKRDLLKDFKAANLFFGVSTSPLIAGDKLLVMVGGPGASIVGLDLQTGKTIWQSGADKASYASPIATPLTLPSPRGGERVQEIGLFFTQQALVALNPADGQTLWRFPMKDLLSESSTTPVRAGDVVFASSVTFGSVGLKLITKDGKPSFEQLWKTPSLTCYFSSPVAFGDHLYVVSGKLPPLASADLHCVEAGSGKTLWTKNKVGTYHATVIRIGDRLLLLEEAGDLVLIEPNSKEYRELARSKVCGQTWAHPALSNGRLYLRDEKELICVQLPTTVQAGDKP
jgi:outer membrane protein assembly factor BamB